MRLTTNKAPRTILFESGPNYYGARSPGQYIRNLATETRAKHGLDLSVLMYTRDNDLPHTNLHVGGSYVEVYNVQGFLKTLNEEGFPFNLALNGSPEYDRHFPLHDKEVRFLAKMEDSGSRNGVRNMVTVADNALVPEIRARFPGLEVAASCISAAFRPNLVSFRGEQGVSFDDPLFFVKYYRYLYLICDRVVSIPQLSTPGFFLALELTKDALRAKTILFLNLGCGSPQIGRCVNHYQGVRNEISRRLPEIPARFLVRAEDTVIAGDATCCRQAFSSLELTSRFADLRALHGLGIFQFKVPARSSRAAQTLDFLCRFLTREQGAAAFPDKPVLWGYRREEIKLSLLENYPADTHQVLAEYFWPGYDADGREAYCGHTANQVHSNLHAMAAQLWAGNRMKLSAVESEK
ncbi:MAG: hypothetical protein MUC35_02710 [Candidatus Margulisbacteria bacterium]|jgi:hypothetical protein|nr:hypothetical protein [Candidatus Margulisiibacteriota bacterium]